jgi:hypothetical protein
MLSVEKIAAYSLSDWSSQTSYMFYQRHHYIY